MTISLQHLAREPRAFGEASGHTIRLLVMVALTVGMLPSTLEAYDSRTHAGLVREAFEFIIASAHDSTPYADRSSGQSDYELVRRVLVPALRNEFEINQELRRRASDPSNYGPVQLLAEASAAT